MNGYMTNARSSVAMFSGILTMRLHDVLNDTNVNEWEWWVALLPAVICLRIFIGAVSGEDW